MKLEHSSLGVRHGVLRPTTNADGPEIGTCANHPTTRATWVCSECQRHLCAACVRAVRLDAERTVMLCKSCDGLCERRNEPAVEGGPSGSFAQGLFGALVYPLKGNGLFVLLGGALPQILIGMLGLYAIPLAFGMGAYIASFLRQIVASSARGESTMPGWPQFDGETLRDAALQFIAVGLVSFGPANLCRIWLAGDPGTTNWTYVALMILGAGYFPIALLGVIIYDDLAALNPLLAIVSILRVPLRYLALCSLLAAGFGLNVLLGAALEHVKVPFLAPVVSTCTSLYGGIAFMRAIGWFYYCSEEQLAWE